MTVKQELTLVAVWFVAGMTRGVFFHKLAEHRIDKGGPATLSPINRNARALRLDAANYDPRGRRLLPWYRVVSTTYWLIVVVVVGLSIYQR
jgi:hypothetical protein